MEVQRRDSKLGISSLGNGGNALNRDFSDVNSVIRSKTLNTLKFIIMGTYILRTCTEYVLVRLFSKAEGVSSVTEYVTDMNKEGPDSTPNIKKKKKKQVIIIEGLERWLGG